MPDIESTRLPGNIHYSRFVVVLPPGVEILLPERAPRGVWDAAIKARTADDLAQFVRTLAMKFSNLAKETEAYASRQNRGA